MENCQLVASKSPTVHIPKEHHDVDCRHFSVADIILQIVWETNTSHAECGQLDLAVNIYCRLYWVHVPIRHYLRTGSMRLLKNMHLISMCAF